MKFGTNNRDMHVVDVFFSHYVKRRYVLKTNSIPFHLTIYLYWNNNS